MKYSIRFLVATMLVFSTATFAATEDGRMAAALRLFEAMDMRLNLARTVEQVVLLEVEKNPKLEPIKGVMLDFMNKYMGFDNLKADLASIYVNAYTQTELEELTRFYQTPVGMKALKQMPELTVQGARLGQRQAEEHLGELEAMLTKEYERRQAQPAK